jgi:hypothetical protein
MVFGLLMIRRIVVVAAMVRCAPHRCQHRMPPVETKRHTGIAPTTGQG